MKFFFFLAFFVSSLSFAEFRPAFLLRDPKSDMYFYVLHDSENPVLDEQFRVFAGSPGKIRLRKVFRGVERLRWGNMAFIPFIDEANPAEKWELQTRDDGKFLGKLLEVYHGGTYSTPVELEFVPLSDSIFEKLGISSTGFPPLPRKTLAEIVRAKPAPHGRIRPDYAYADEKGNQIYVTKPDATYTKNPYGHRVFWHPYNSGTVFELYADGPFTYFTDRPVTYRFWAPSPERRNHTPSLEFRKNTVRVLFSLGSHFTSAPTPTTGFLVEPPPEIRKTPLLFEIEGEETYLYADVRLLGESDEHELFIGRPGSWTPLKVTQFNTYSGRILESEYGSLNFQDPRVREDSKSFWRFQPVRLVALDRPEILEMMGIRLERFALPVLETPCTEALDDSPEL